MKCGVETLIHKNTRKLRLIDDRDYGFTEGDMIAVNIQRLWEEADNESEFIKTFAQTYMHELLHLVLEYIEEKFPDLGEEMAIRRLCKEPWNNTIKKLYENQLN